MKHSIARRLTMCVFTMFAGAAMAQTGDTQVADDEWMPVVDSPAYALGAGPSVLVDDAHGNFHTVDGRFAAFARLLQLDGYNVAGAGSEVSEALLDSADVYVVSNANKGGNSAEWVLPTPSAFTADEIRVLVNWVRQGGALLLIADHMPFPGATAALANEFGIIFLNGFAIASVSDGGITSFSKSSGALADHAITRGRSSAEEIDSIMSFAGQAFRYVNDTEPLMYMPDDWEVLLPGVAWEFDDATPRVSARGLVQGAVLRFGEGKVAIFGEAAMFTAQSATRDGIVYHMGMNHPAATQNAQFVLNVMHWLTGLLEE